MYMFNELHLCTCLMNYIYVHIGFSQSVSNTFSITRKKVLCVKLREVKRGGSDALTQCFESVRFSSESCSTLFHVGERIYVARVCVCILTTNGRCPDVRHHCDVTQGWFTCVSWEHDEQTAKWLPGIWTLCRVLGDQLRDSCESPIELGR
jgi:hypothetical protein